MSAMTLCSQCAMSLRRPVSRSCWVACSSSLAVSSQVCRLGDRQVSNLALTPPHSMPTPFLSRSAYSPDSPKPCSARTEFCVEELVINRPRVFPPNIFGEC